MPCAALFRATVLAPLIGHPLRGLLPSVVGGYHEKWPIRASLRHPASARFAIRPTASGDMLAIYIYVFGSQSCATRLIFAGSAPLAAAKQAAHGTLGNWVKATHTRRSLRGKARLFPRAASTIRVTMLRRRNTASLPRLRLVSHHANRRLAVPLRSLLARAALTRPSAMARFSS